MRKSELQDRPGRERRTTAGSTTLRSLALAAVTGESSGGASVFAPENVTTGRVPRAGSP